MDTSTQLSDAVQALLRDRIHSVEELETLLLLRSDKVRAWGVAEVASALRIGASAVDVAFANLAARGLCTPTPSGARTYKPESVELEKSVDELAQAYTDQRIEVLVFISQSAISRVRTNALRTFAEAFQIPRGRKDG